MHRLLLRLSIAVSLCFLISVLLLTSCATESVNSLGYAYVAPATLAIRRDLREKNSAAAAIANHGERLSIVDVRRRYIKVRTRSGAEGWVDAAQLLSPEQMKRIDDDTARALNLPSEGTATAFEALNIHIDPLRTSPAFARIPEGGAVQVLARKLVPKATGPAVVSPFALIKPSLPAKRQRKERAAKAVSLKPPKPPAPKAPENWEELSAERINKPPQSAEALLNGFKNAPAKRTPVTPLVPLEDWSLIRTKDKQCGWALTRNLTMAIPDEVAQYAEGKHITSYFDLGVVNDEEKGTKHNWLWTTVTSGETSDFDGWRVFLWSRHHHRYETSYRQRDVEGYFPVHVDPPDTVSGGRQFELITKDDDSKMRRRTYVFDGARVHLTATEDYHAGQDSNNSPATSLDVDQLEAKKPQPNWLSRQLNGVFRLFGKAKK